MTAVSRFLLVAALTAAALAALPSAQASIPPPGLAHDCITVYDFPDEGLVLCYDLSRSDCKVWEVHTTFIGTETTCIVGAQENSASAGVACMPVYSRTDVGTYSVVRRDSCSPPQVYECPYPGAPISSCQDLLQLRTASALASPMEAQPTCLEYYSDWTVGPVHHHQTDSCHSTNDVCGVDQSQVAAWVASDPGAAVSCATGGITASSSASQPLPPVGQRTCYHQGQGELQSEYCVDPNSTSCTVYESRSTGVSYDWWCYPSGQHGGSE